MSPARSTAPERQPLATLPMYDLPEVREATDEFWSAIAAALMRSGILAPAGLERSGGPVEAIWTHPDLLFSQTCGYPLMTDYRNSLTVVGAPAYRAAGCEGPIYRAVVIVRTGSPAAVLADLRGARCAVNDPRSNTGMNLLRAEVSRLASARPFFSEVIATGSHAMSLWHVAEGAADVACIDPVTFALLQRHRPAITRRVRELHWTAPSPGLPFVTSRRQPHVVAGALRHILAELARAPALRAVRDELLLGDVAILPTARYEAILSLERAAAESGYPELR
jgi:ABC-type phosphate/phosphonate transport system substrate-binding protein